MNSSSSSKRLKPSTSSSSRPPQPSTSNSVLQCIAGSKANPHHNSMKIWRKLNMPESAYDLFQPNVFSMPEKLLRHSAKVKPFKGPREKKSKKGVKSELIIQIFTMITLSIFRNNFQRSNLIQSSVRNVKNFERNLSS